MRTGKIIFIYLFGIVFCYNQAYSQSDSESSLALVSESEFFVELPSVATVTRLPTPKADTPAAVTVIDRDMIRATGARDLSDLFRLVPGFQVATPRGSKPAATYHGVGDEFTRRMQILIDGRSVYGALFGHVTWATQGIAIEDIERIEIVRGPNSVSYGANAFLGTINIITRHSAQNSGGSFKLTSGDNGIGDVFGRYGGQLDNGDIRVSVGYKSDEGLQELTDDSEIRFANLRSDLQLTSNDSLLLQASVSQAKVEEGSAGSVFSPTTISTTDAHFEQIRWQHNFAAGNELSLQFYHNYRKLDYNFLTQPINLGFPFGTVQLPVDFDATAKQYEIELQHTLSLWEDWRFVWGIADRQDEIESEAFFADEESVKRDLSRIFGNAEWQASPGIIVNAGVMWEDTTFAGSEYSPRLAVNYHLGSTHTLRAVWSKARRIASLFEEKGNFQFTFQNIPLDQTFDSQGGLDVETMTSFELGYLGQYRNTNTTLDMRIYRDRISDFISIVVIPAVDLNDNLAASYRNEGRITVTGIDLELSYRPSRDNRAIFTLAFMDADASDVADDNIVDQQLRVDSVPDYSGSLLLMHRFSDTWSASAGLYWTDEMAWLNSSEQIDSYQRLDLRLARQLRIAGRRGELAVVVQNAGDDYEDFRSGQFFETGAFVTFGINL